jgi:uncharacterized Ntn-hydrolase superfamily protein/phosphohistidine phosphatase SixA
MSSRLSTTSQQPIHTYSIVARDARMGEMGVAVQSHWFSVGVLCPWAEAGVGAVATQSFVNVSFGPRGLDLLREGRTAAETVAALIEGDDAPEVRQLAVVDRHGNVAAHTGSRCVPEAGHLVGDGFSVQANLMLSAQVWPAMAEAFKASAGPLAERLVTALEAAQAAGGDIRGAQSAALLVVRAEPGGAAWEDRLVDLRVEDHPQPVAELRRLLRVQRAYEHMNRGDAALEAGDVEGALAAYRAAEAMFPDNLEMQYWHAVALANLGRVQEALPVLRHVFAEDPNWRTLTARLPAVGLLEVSDETLRQILGQGEGTMKTIYLMRHGKSKRGPQFETDYERPLAKRGKRDAARMGEHMAQHDLLPERIVSSSAERARDTALRFAEAADYQGEIQFDEGLYMTDEEAYLDLIWALDDSLASVMFVGHNPATESAIETLSDAYLRMPTAAVACVRFEVETWAEVEEGMGHLVWVERPKELE